MTETEWLASSDPAAMLQTVCDRTSSGRPRITNRISDRKLRLFAVACCRQPEVWDRLTDDVECPTCGGSGEDQRESTFGDCPNCAGTGRINRSRRAVEVAERYADGMATEEELAAAENAANSAWDGWRGDDDGYGARYNAAVCCDSIASEAARMIVMAQPGYQPPATQAALLRTIVGNPFRRCCKRGRPLPLRPEQYDTNPLERWLAHDDGAVAKIARAIYDGRRWDEMPILADALTDAGCENEEILQHCRGQERCPECVTSNESGWRHRHGRYGPGYYSCERCDLTKEGRRGTGWIHRRGPHVRGDWVLDLLLGKG